jgi:CBS domain-containing protein
MRLATFGGIKPATEVTAMRVRELMTDQVKTVPPGCSLQDVARLMRDQDIGSIPVAENDRLVGMVTDRDIVIRGLAETGHLEEKCARDVMSQQVLYCREDETVEAVLKNMGEQQIRRLPVVDESKHLVGVISIGDLSSRARTTTTGEALKEISKPSTH